MNHPTITHATDSSAQLHPLFADILGQHATIATRFAAPSVVADMQSIADGMRARAAAKRAAVPPVPPRLKIAQTRAELLAELAAEQQGFDAAYQWSDDQSVYSFHAQKEQRIKALQVLLSGVQA